MKNMAISVGIRALKINAGDVIRRVRSGETVEVTDHGRPVARIVPWKAESTYERLVADGVLIPARDHRGLEDWEPLPPKEGKQLSEILREMRDEERY